jgi:hypothetical protein
MPPPPGRYRVFWLPRARFVIALDGALTTGMRSVAPVKAALRRCFRLDDAGVAALRSGDLGRAGRHRLAAMIALRAAGLVAVLGVLAVDATRRWQEPMWMLVVLLACGTAVVYLALRIRRLALDHREGGVLRSTGEIHTDLGPGRARWGGSRRMWVDSQPRLAVWLPEVAARVLVTHVAYAVYHTPRARAVVGIEPIDDLA